MMMERDNDKPVETGSYTDDEIKADPRGVLAAVMDIEKENDSFDYRLRRRILVLSNRTIKTHQAFVKDSWILNPVGKTYDEIEKYLDDESNWLDERITLHNRIVEDGYSLGMQLSDHVKEKSSDKTPTVFMVRGNIGAGKTQAIRNHPLFKPLLDEKQEPTGVVSPDNLKAEIREELGKNGDDYILGHFQYHDESLAIARKLETKLLSNPNLSIAFDERFAWMDRIEKLISRATKHGRKIKILDLDVPLEVSIIRNLKRDLRGKDPCVPYEVIRGGFVDIRNTRLGLANIVINKVEISYYLLSESSNSPIKNVAEKIKGKFKIIMPVLFRRIRSLNQGELSKLDGQVIDETYIDHVQHLLSKQSFKPDEKVKILNLLKKHQGELLRTLVDKKSRGEA